MKFQLSTAFAVTCLGAISTGLIAPLAFVFSAQMTEGGLLSPIALFFLSAAMSAIAFVCLVRIVLNEHPPGEQPPENIQI